MEPTEAMVNMTVESIGYSEVGEDTRKVIVRATLRAILRAPQDYGLIVPPTRSDLHKVPLSRNRTHSIKTGYSLGDLVINDLIAAGWATEDPIPEPAPVPTVDDATRALTEYGAACAKLGDFSVEASHYWHKGVNILTQLAEREAADA